MPFQIKPLPKSQFEPLFDLSPDELASRGALRVLASEKPGFPCRVSLVDAEVGETVMLVHYEHQSAATPFRASHAVYVRPGTAQAETQPNEVPEMLRSRLLSLRGFDRSGMLIAADVTNGTEFELFVHQLFEDTRVEYIHVHFAKPGCYAALVVRA